MTDNSNIVFSESANLRLPSTKFEDISEIESYEFKNKNRFDLVKINNVNNADKQFRHKLFDLVENIYKAKSLDALDELREIGEELF